MPSPLDSLIAGFDRSLRTLSGAVAAQRPTPAQNLPEGQMSEAERAHAAGLMRVNHCGEICAQALYEGQAFTARSDAARSHLLEAAEEERDHLAWCKERLDALDAKPSVLDPLFYAASWTMGAVTGMAGDKVSMGFVEATEDQVVKHIDQHLDTLPENDQKSRAVLQQMRAEESAHGQAAMDQGGVEFPPPVKAAMTLMSRVMTHTTYQR